MDTTNWKWFRCDEIFEEISIANSSDLNNLEIDPCGVNYLSRAVVNNGYECKVKRVEDKLTRGNFVSVVMVGVPSSAFFQPNDVICSQNILVLRYPAINQYNALFISTILQKDRYRYSYGRTLSKATFLQSRIKLPVTPEGTPDWKYMEDFIKDQIIPQLPKKAQKVWMQKYDTKPLQPENMKLNTQDWKWFTINEIFEVKAGKYHYKNEYEEGNTPYLSATAVNNGVGERISLPSEFDGGVITTEKVKCTAFFQPTPFCATSDVNIIKRKDGSIMNQYVGLFIATIIDFNESYRWTYGRQCRVNDTENIRIKLPVTPEGTPDWQFMENYIKSLPYSKNIEPSQPNEIIDEMMEVKKEIISLRKQLQSQHAAQVVNYGTININDNSKNIKF